MDFSVLGVRVFIGRPNGKKARKHFKLDALDVSKDKIRFKVPENTISINSSFFLGLFAQEVIECGSVEKFFEYVDISQVDERFQEQLRSVVSRSLFNKNLKL